MRSNTISNRRDSTAQWIDTAGFWSRTKTSSKDEHPQLTYHKYLYGLAMRQASLGRGARSNRPPPGWRRLRLLREIGDQLAAYLDTGSLRDYEWRARG